MDEPAPSAPVEEHRFPCPNCGSDMRFDPGRGNLTCDHCGNEEPLPPVSPFARMEALRELDLREGVQELRPDQIEETRVTQCPNCGARFELDPAVHASECPFCATPVVADTGVDRHIKPTAILPFGITETDARGSLKTWLTSRWFAPNGLKQYARAGRRMSGMYVPYWTFDAKSRSAYSGMRGDHYYVSVRDSEGNTRQERRTRWRSASGTVRLTFDDVLVLGSTSLPKPLTDALEPWDLHNLAPYEPAVIAGFRAEAYTVELVEAQREARQRMDIAIEQAVRRDIGGDVQRITSIDTVLSDRTYKHVQLPIWIAAYKYSGKSYRFVVNGRTGEVQGERPYSKWKIFFAILAALIALTIGLLIYDEIETGGQFRDSIIGSSEQRFDGPEIPIGGDPGGRFEAPDIISDRPRIPIGGDLGGDFIPPD